MNEQLVREYQFLCKLPQTYEIIEFKKEIMTQIIENNNGLIYNLAKNKSHIPIQDAKQMGIMGLMKAVEKFDCDKGYKFSTYATWWIKSEISRSGLDYFNMKYSYAFYEVLCKYLSENPDNIEDWVENLEIKSGLKDRKAIIRDLTSYNEFKLTGGQDFLNLCTESHENICVDSIDGNILINKIRNINFSKPQMEVIELCIAGVDRCVISKTLGISSQALHERIKKIKPRLKGVLYGY